MSTSTKIEWTRGDDGSAGATWNPVTGCSEVSEGCDHCYAKTFAERWRGVPGHPFEQGFDVRLWPGRLEKPLSWRKPRRVFVNSMSDLFHDAVPTEFIARVFATMALSSRHTYQLLTKRAARMRSVLSSEDFREAVAEHASDIIGSTPPHLGGWRLDLGGQRVAGDSGLGGDWTVTPAQDGNLWSPPWPLPNVWLGVSVETQKWADIRIPKLTQTPAAVRFLSCEPLLGPVDLDDLAGLHWVIAGGESGAGARPMSPGWARSLRDQCQAAGVPFFFKQWGQYRPSGPVYQPGETQADWDEQHLELCGSGCAIEPDGTRPVRWSARDVTITTTPTTRAWWMTRVRAKAEAGRELDGRAWDEYPEVPR